jgi:hypothetical protein
MPTIDIPDKICSHCGGIKWVVYQKTRTLASGEKKTYTNYKCAKKNLEHGAKWRDLHKEQHRKNAREYVKLRIKTDPKFASKEREKKKIYYKEHKEERQLYRKEWAKANIEKDRAYYRKSMKKQVENLTDYYIRRRVIGRDKLFKDDIPKELVEIKRKELLLTRQIKNNGKSNQHI